GAAHPPRRATRDRGAPGGRARARGARHGGGRHPDRRQERVARLPRFLEPIRFTGHRRGGCLVSARPHPEGKLPMYPARPARVVSVLALSGVLLLATGCDPFDTAPSADGPTQPTGAPTITTGPSQPASSPAAPKSSPTRKVYPTGPPMYLDS